MNRNYLQQRNLKIIVTNDVHFATIEIPIWSTSNMCVCNEICIIDMHCICNKYVNFSDNTETTVETYLFQKTGVE